MKFNYERDCQQVNLCGVVMSRPEERVLEFKNCKNKLRDPYIVFADIECFLKPCDSKKGKRH